MGLHADILVPKGQSGSGLLGGRFDHVTIINADGPFEPSEDAPPVKLEQGPGGRGHIIAVPVESEFSHIPEKKMRIASNAYILGDSRMADLIEKLGGVRTYNPVSLHDHYCEWPR